MQLIPSEIQNSMRYHRFEHRNLANPFVLSLVLFTVAIVARPQVLAQTKPEGREKSPLCTRDNAIEMIKQQVALSKTIDHSVRRITVLVKAADLLWPYEQNRARAIFTEAFEVAGEYENENQRKGSQVLLLRLRVPDQRYTVIRAVARRDSEWSKELTRRVLKAADESTSAKSSIDDGVTAARLLDSAIKLLPADTTAASDLARSSFNYPASSWLTHFLYELAKVNQQAADQFYSQALAVYADRPMREFLYLQAYPFAWRETLNTPIFSFYQVPSNFTPTPSLQRRFVQVLLRRAQQAVELPPDESDVYRHSNGTLMSGKVHLLLGLMLLEPQIKESLPDLWSAITLARDRILVSLPVDTQKQLQQPGRGTSTASEPGFEEQVEIAQKEPDVDERNGLIATAVLSRGVDRDTDVAKVVNAIEKISESDLRAVLLEWFYFQRAVLAIKEKQFPDAEKLTSKIEGLEQRAYLHSEIAKGLLSQTETQSHGRDLLDEAVVEAKKVGVSIFAARTLLAISNLYAKIDLSQSISLLTDAVNCINRLENPDFVADDQTLEKTPERKSRGGQYAGEYELRFYMPGPDPQAAFREMAKFDFDTTLAQTSGLTDKFQRAMSIMGLVDVCLQQQPKVKPRKRTQT